LLREYHRLKREVKDLAEVKNELEEKLIALKKRYDELEGRLRKLRNTSRSSKGILKNKG